MLELIISREDAAIAKMYPALTELDGVFLYEFKSKRTLAAIDACLLGEGMPDLKRPRRMYDLTHRLQSQLLSVIYDMETFGGATEQIANAHSSGNP